MNRVIIGSFAAALAGTLTMSGVARGTVQISESAPTRVNVGNGSYDRLIFKVSGLTGVDASAGAASGITLLQGRFTGVSKDASTTYLAVPGDSSPASTAYWANYITGPNGVRTLTNQDDFTTFNAATSVVNLPSLIPDSAQFTKNRANDGILGSSTKDSTGAPATLMGTSSFFQAGWFSTSGAVLLNGTLATIFVTPGEDVNFTGIYSSFQGANSQPITFGAAVPEPASLSVLGLGLGGLLLRRRKM